MEVKLGFGCLFNRGSRYKDYVNIFRYQILNKVVPKERYHCIAILRFKSQKRNPRSLAFIILNLWCLTWYPSTLTECVNCRMTDYLVSVFFLFVYQNACVDNNCSWNSRCQTGFTDRGYRCVCDTGITGEFCETGNNHVKGWRLCSCNSFFVNVVGLRAMVKPKLAQLTNDLNWRKVIGASVFSKKLSAALKEPQ